MNDGLLCQICGVQFNTSRLRREDEDLSAAWDSSGTRPFQESLADIVTSCGVGSGCKRNGNDIFGEHIAGPGCVSLKGYSGHRLLVTDTEGHRAVQALVEKGDILAWEPEADDEGFEPGYFLTGIGDIWLNDYNQGCLSVPVRHKLDVIWVANDSDDASPDYPTGMPFHSTCFEIFRKASTQKLGIVDVHGLFTWYWQYSDFFESFPRNPAVINATCYQRCWRHIPGDEYLATNPLNIVGLASMIASCARKTEEPLKMPIVNPETGDYRGLPQHYLDDYRVVALLSAQYEQVLPVEETPGNHIDPFRILPTEIAYMIIENLPNKDIANLRLVTRSLSELLDTLFRKFVFRDMPWLWEAQDLPIRETHWHQLYVSAKFSWVSLKGLKNRKRIWKDVQEILRRIDQYRHEGMIQDFTGNEQFQE